MCSGKLNFFLLCISVFLSSSTFTWAMEDEGVSPSFPKISSLNMSSLSTSSDENSEEGKQGASTEERSGFGTGSIYLASPRHSNPNSPHTPPLVGHFSPAQSRLVPESPHAEKRSRTGSYTSRPKTGRSNRSFIGTARKGNKPEASKPKRVRLTKEEFSPRGIARSSLGGSKELGQSELENKNYTQGLTQLREVTETLESWVPQRIKQKLEQALEEFGKAQQQGHSFAALKKGEVCTLLGLMMLPEELREPTVFLKLKKLPEKIKPDDLDEALLYFKKAAEEGTFKDDDLDDPYENKGYEYQGYFEGKLYYAKFCYLIGEFYRKQMIVINIRGERDTLRQKAKEYFYYAKQGNLEEGHIAEAELSSPHPKTDVWWLREEEPQAPAQAKLQKAQQKKSNKQKLSSEDEKILRANAFFEAARGEPSNASYREAMMVLTGLQDQKKKMDAAEIPVLFERVFFLLESAEKDGHPLAPIKLGEARRRYGMWLLPASLHDAEPPTNLSELTNFLRGLKGTDLDQAIRQFRLSFQCGDDLGRRWYMSLSHVRGILYMGEGNTSSADDYFYRAANLNNQLAQDVWFEKTKKMVGAQSFTEGNQRLENSKHSYSESSVSELRRKLLDSLGFFKAANRERFVHAERRMGEVNRHLGILNLSSSLRTAETLNDVKELLDLEPTLKALDYFEEAMKQGDHEGTKWYARLSYILGEFYQQKSAKDPHPKGSKNNEVHPDLERARKSFADSARLGNPNGQYAFACILEDGEEKMKWLRKAAKSGNPLAMKDLADLLDRQKKYPLEVGFWLTKFDSMRFAILQQGMLPQLRFNKAQENYLEAMKVIDRGDFEQAARMLRTSSEFGHIPSSYALMYCYGQLEDVDKLQKVQDRLVDQGEEEGLCLVAKRVEAEDQARAKSHYIEAIQSHYPIAYFDFGQFLTNQGKFKEAITFFRELTYLIESCAIKAHETMIQYLEWKKKSADAHQWREGISKLRSDQSTSYLATFGPPLERDVGDVAKEILFKLPPLCFYEIQKAFLAKDEMEKGLLYFRRFLNSLRDFSSLAHYNLGLLNEAQRNMGVALNDFEVSGTLGFSEGMFVRALYYVEEGKRKTAKEWLEKVVKNEEGKSNQTGAMSEIMQEAALELAFMAQEEEGFSAAENWYRIILDKDPNSTRALINLGLLLHTTKPMEEERLFARAAELKDAKALSLMGDISLQRGDVTKGKSYYERAYGLGRASAAYKLGRLAKDPKEVLMWDVRAAQLGKLEAMINVSEYNLLLGNTKLARVWESKIVEQSGGRKKLGLSLIGRKDKDSKERGYKKLVELDPERKDPEISSAIAEYKIDEGQDVNQELWILIRLAEHGDLLTLRKIYQIGLALNSEDVEEKSPHLYTTYGERCSEQAHTIFKLLVDDIKVTPREIFEEAAYQCGKLLCASDKRRGKVYIEKAAHLGHKGAKVLLEEMNN